MNRLYQELSKYMKGSVQRAHHHIFQKKAAIYCFLILLVNGISLSFASDEIAWQNIGPGGGGWIECLAVDPMNPLVVYTGTDVGGIFKSTDGGDSWRASNSGLMNDFVREIAIDQNNSRIIYAATSGGVHKSIDSGRTWGVLRNGFPEVSADDFSAPVNTIAIDPHDSNILYVGIGKRNSYGRGQIYKSIAFPKTKRLI